SAFGIAYARVDGNDSVAVARAAQAAAADLREGRGPFVLECITDRVRGHYEGDPQKYRDPAELQALAAKDPLQRMRGALEAAGVPESRRVQAEAEVKERVERAI